MNLPPTLVIDAIELGDERVFAELRIGPRREQIAVGFSIPNLIEYKKIPRIFGDEFRAKRAVIDVLARAYNGEQMSLPLDLSPILFGDEPKQWPLYQRVEDHESDPPTPIEVMRVEHDVPASGVTTVHLDVLGSPTVVTVRPGDNNTVLFSFVSGVHPWQLDDVEAWAMLTALLGALKPG